MRPDGFLDCAELAPAASLAAVFLCLGRDALAIGPIIGGTGMSAPGTRVYVRFEYGPVASVSWPGSDRLSRSPNTASFTPLAVKWVQRPWEARPKAGRVAFPEN